MYIAIVCFLVCDVINAEINLFFLIKSFFLREQKVKTKIENLEKEKRFYGEIKTGYETFCSGKKAFLLCNQLLFSI